MAGDPDLRAVVAILTEGHVELRQDMKELRDSVNTLVITHTESIAEQRGYNRDVAILREEIYGKEGGILTRLSAQEIAQSNDKLRWGLLTAIAFVFLSGIGGLYTIVVKPFQDSQVTNSKVAEKLDEQNERLTNIFDAMVDHYGKP